MLDTVNHHMGVRDYAYTGGNGGDEKAGGSRVPRSYVENRGPGGRPDIRGVRSGRTGDASDVAGHPDTDAAAVPDASPKEDASQKEDAPKGLKSAAGQSPKPVPSDEAGGFSLSDHLDKAADAEDCYKSEATINLRLLKSADGLALKFSGQVVRGAGIGHNGAVGLAARFQMARGKSLPVYRPQESRSAQPQFF